MHYKSHSTGADGAVAAVHVEYEPALKGKPPKGVVNWVARPAPGKEPMRAEARLYADAVSSPELLRPCPAACVLRAVVAACPSDSGCPRSRCCIQQAGDGEASGLIYLRDDREPPRSRSLLTTALPRMRRTIVLQAAVSLATRLCSAARQPRVRPCSPASRRALCVRGFLS